ncbi:MAG: hypothetical protein ACI9VT_001595 [Psychroserpens sp.]|jgi:hypothetical protein
MGSYLIRLVLGYLNRWNDSMGARMEYGAINAEQLTLGKYA